MNILVKTCPPGTIGGQESRQRRRSSLVIWYVLATFATNFKPNVVPVNCTLSQIFSITAAETALLLYTEHHEDLIP